MKLSARSQTNSFLYFSSAFLHKHLLLCFMFVANGIAHAQCLLPSLPADTLFPVTNRYETAFSLSPHIFYDHAASVFNVAKNDGKYYLFGRFSSLSLNHGPALVIDSGTTAVRTPQKWKVNGTVWTAVPDGQGGFFIGGNFTKIGDSIRKYIARIDANGRPSAWNPQANGVVRAMQKRNDTLYIAGDFSTFLSRLRAAIAIYSITGDSLIRSRIPWSSSVNSFLLQRDTLIYSGDGSRRITKYNIKDSLGMQWNLPYTEFGPPTHLQFNEDSSLIIYQSEYNGQVLKAFKTQTGVLQYSIGLSMNPAGGFTSGTVFGMRRIGKKMYAVGHFEAVQSQSTGYNRRGFFSFDGNTGAISPDDLHLNLPATFVETSNGKLFISGSFNTVNGVDRLHFAVLDTGSLTVSPWQLAPSNEITAMAFHNGSAFVGGHFNGINAVQRKGFAAIDSATRAILPWNPGGNEFQEGKRMQIHGDTLFILGITGRPNSCMINDFNTAFRMYRLSNGQPISSLGVGGSDKIYDFIIDSGYLYLSAGNRLQRYSLPNLTYDVSWGATYFGGMNMMYLMTMGDKVYGVGDNRFENKCTALPERTGWFFTFNKSTGAISNYYSYKGDNPYYQQITFDHALLVNNKLYIQGYFKILNGKSRANFACIDINTGAITDWETSFSQTSLPDFSFQRSSDLKLHNGQIWFSSTAFAESNGRTFNGFGTIDTATGILLPPLFKIGFINTGYTSFLKSVSFQDFHFTGDNLMAVGGFDYINTGYYTSIVRFSLAPGTAPPANPVTVIGPDTIYANNQYHRFNISPANMNLYSYKWIYTGTGVSVSDNGRDTVRVKADNGAMGGNLVVTVVNHCGTTTVGQKTIVVLPPPPPLPTPVITGLSNKCFASPDARAKITNPPAADVAITVSRNGVPLSYNAADSSFQYFTTQQIPSATYTITVKFKHTIASMDSVSQNFTFNVFQTAVPTITITGNTTVNTGDSTDISASPANGGTLPTYEWQDSTQIHSWQNIAGAVNATIRYKPIAAGDKIRCILTSNALCGFPATATSNHLSFTVNIPTAVNPSPVFAKTIRLYPNPALTSITIDTLRLADNWRTLVIFGITGQKPVATYSIQNKTRATIPVSQLSKGMYIVVLRRKNGTAEFRAFVKL